ncbi:hypothetical protein DPMN_180253 [Dreissena polymorpha]|uniref:Uncharacterized protein n=1 Tax=Dreissena polymorpha TaxID=45954 RepID=A0A9D4EEE0_DREPO|nr:hypothetical protein DPMN_180253 [Dreissena polymorpha]
MQSKIIVNSSNNINAEITVNSKKNLEVVYSIKKDKTFQSMSEQLRSEKELPRRPLQWPNTAYCVQQNHSASPPSTGFIRTLVVPILLYGFETITFLPPNVHLH